MAVLQRGCPRHAPSISKAWSRQQSTAASWKSPKLLDEWVEREAKPISLRQLTVFGRSLTEARLLSSANYVRTELPTRIAHRLRNMQTLPYAVITNPHMSHVYELYYQAFDSMCRLREIKTAEDNHKLCRIIAGNLRDHISVIPRLVSGVIECMHAVPADTMDTFMSTMLRSRISRRVIAEQHLALTADFDGPKQTPNSKTTDCHGEFIGEVFLRCNAREIVLRAAKVVEELCRQTYGPDITMPKVEIKGHVDATLTYIPSHLEYVVGELLRNSMQSLIENRGKKSTPAPIEVLICEAPQHVIFRISDRGGGVPAHMVPLLWSFVKGPRKQMRLENLNKVPQSNATPDETQNEHEKVTKSQVASIEHEDTLNSLSVRRPNLRLGIGLPMSKVYAEYWAGSIQLRNLEGYGVDVFLQISKLGNKNEQLSTRATMDAL